MTQELSVQRASNGFLTTAMTANDIVAQVQLIQDVMAKVMHDGEHYGVIPGCKKPSLLKCGAEKLCLLFRLDAQFETQEHYDGAHYTVKSKCTLYHIPTGQRVGSGEGSCSTKETKYAYRDAARTCPACGKDSIRKGKKDKGGGWYCWAKIGGCGQTWVDGAQEIESQQTGKVANENLADQYNTVLKMSDKRALVAATLIATAASDLFTQDVEDMPTVVIDADATVKPQDAPQSTQTAKEAPKAAPRKPDAPKATPAPQDERYVLPVGEEVDLPGHECEKCNQSRYKVGLSKSQKNPNRLFFQCMTKDCGEQNGRWFNQSFGGWLDEVLPKFEEAAK